MPHRASPRARARRDDDAPIFTLPARKKTLPEVFQFDLTKHAPCWKNLINRSCVSRASRVQGSPLACASGTIRESESHGCVVAFLARRPEELPNKEDASQQGAIENGQEESDQEIDQEGRREEEVAPVPAAKPACLPVTTRKAGSGCWGHVRCRPMILRIAANFPTSAPLSTGRPPRR